MLTHTPVKIHFTATHCCTITQDLFHQAMWFKPCRNGCNTFSQTLKFRSWNSRVSSISPFTVEEWNPIHSVFVFEVRDYRIMGMLTSIHCVTELFYHCIATIGRNRTLGRQFVRVHFTCARVLTNFFVHQRLCQCWRILFVMT